MIAHHRIRYSLALCLSKFAALVHHNGMLPCNFLRCHVHIVVAALAALAKPLACIHAQGQQCDFHQRSCRQAIQADWGGSPNAHPNAPDTLPNACTPGHIHMQTLRHTHAQVHIDRQTHRQTSTDTHTHTNTNKHTTQHNITQRNTAQRNPEQHNTTHVCIYRYIH